MRKHLPGFMLIICILYLIVATIDKDDTSLILSGVWNVGTLLAYLINKKEE